MLYTAAASRFYPGASTIPPLVHSQYRLLTKRRSSSALLSMALFADIVEPVSRIERDLRGGQPPVRHYTIPALVQVEMAISSRGSGVMLQNNTVLSCYPTPYRSGGPMLRFELTLSHIGEVPITLHRLVMRAVPTAVFSHLLRSLKSVGFDLAVRLPLQARATT